MTVDQTTDGNSSVFRREDRGPSGWFGADGIAGRKRASRWTSRVEWFETNPVEEPDMDQWVSRLTFKLAD